jgi:hypothetical protein
MAPSARTGYADRAAVQSGWAPAHGPGGARYEPAQTRFCSDGDRGGRRDREAHCRGFAHVLVAQLRVSERDRQAERGEARHGDRPQPSAAERPSHRTQHCTTAYKSSERTSDGRAGRSPAL